MLYWIAVWVGGFAWVFGIGLQSRAIVAGHYPIAATSAACLAVVQMFIVRAAVWDDPWLFGAVSGTSYAAGAMASIWASGRLRGIGQVNG